MAHKHEPNWASWNLLIRVKLLPCSIEIDWQLSPLPCIAAQDRPWCGGAPVASWNDAGNLHAKDILFIYHQTLRGHPQFAKIQSVGRFFMVVYCFFVYPLIQNGIYRSQEVQNYNHHFFEGSILGHQCTLSVFQIPWAPKKNRNSGHDFHSYGTNPDANHWQSESWGAAFDCTDPFGPMLVQHRGGYGRSFWEEGFIGIFKHP